ncbi:hypothetical protein O181_070242 [Austropuccinia psidii MF-1]|uniref:Uncharacterized protein n=1 Tax=Austropuccinia psidii MF-1 TaxID=1389203 RepID=A0A9Q3F2U0_9BASI|nr:hypothetical protein [Austropuccinia psidii MF-1]
MWMGLKQIHTDWPQVSRCNRVSVCSQAAHPTKKIAGRKTGSKMCSRHMTHRGVCMKACGFPTVRMHDEQAGPVIVCPNNGTGVNPLFVYNPNNKSSHYDPLTLTWITPASVP